MTPPAAARPSDLSFAILGSGSSGNATLVETSRTRLLIDAGLSARETERRLGEIGRDLRDVHAILVSHEHDDHSRGLEVLTRRHRLTVCATRGTLRSLAGRLAPGTDQVELEGGRSTRFGDLTIDAVGLPHDAVDPAGFRLSTAIATLGHFTDLGTIDGAVAEALCGVQALVIESNHDVDLVKTGPYPLSLKRRLLSPVGHLSNEALAEFLRHAPLGDLALLYLAHLSRTNNQSHLAEASARLALDRRGSGVAIRVARHDRPSPVEVVPAATIDSSGAAAQRAAAAAAGRSARRRSSEQLIFQF